MIGIDWSEAPKWAKSVVGPSRGDGQYYWHAHINGEGSGECIKTGRIRCIDTTGNHSWNIIPRPTKTERSDTEWVDGLPPIGTHVEVDDDGSLHYGSGESGEVIAHVENTAVIRMSYGLGCFTAKFLRPIPTPEEKQREELIEALSLPLDGLMLTTSMKVSIADAILSKYNLTEK